MNQFEQEYHYKNDYDMRKPPLKEVTISRMNEIENYKNQIRQSESENQDYRIHLYFDTSFISNYD